MRSQSKLSEILEEFTALDDRELRGELLIEFAERFKPVPEHIARHPYPGENRVPACESEAYVWSRPLDEGGFKFYFAVENPQGISAKALSVLLDETLSGAPVAEIAAVNEDLVYLLFGRNLAMGKGQGLMSIVRMVKMLAGTQQACRS